MKTLHIIFNAHLDPIWLWPWQAGLDEALATCRSACDRLDANPDIVFNRGEAWVYEQIERVDPALFARIKAHIEAGRWEIVGGWWIQPDCNLPSEWAMRHQIGLGKEYFQSRFGQFPRTGYNVDSFGHSAALPDLMAAAGQDSYIMMRPDSREMELPANVFRWRGYKNGPVVLTSRIPGYQTNTDLHIDYIHRCIAHMPDGLDDAICLVGIGDHGGGPTEQQIALCREYKDAIPGWQIAFSSISRYFNAVRPHIDKLPIVTGDLQPHAVGCYSVYRPVKTALRRAEQLLAQAEIAAAPDDVTALHDAWKRVAFNHFHDTLGGTSIPSGYTAALDQLSGASATADEILQINFRRKMTALPDDIEQRVVMYNASPKPFDGYVEFEPWVDWWQPWLADCALVSEQGERVPYQVIESEAHARFNENGSFTRLLFPANLAAEEISYYRIARNCGIVTFPQRVSTTDSTIANDAGIIIAPSGPQNTDSLTWPKLSLELIEDDTDTWGHGIDGFSSTPIDTVTWGSSSIIDSGPIMASLAVEGSIGNSKLNAEWRVYAAAAYADLTLKVDYQERNKLLKLAFHPATDFAEMRRDGVMGTSLVRKNNAAERPLRDWTLIKQTNGFTLGVVAPDVFGIDATPARLGLTLLRSPMMAHHEPVIMVDRKRAVVSDRGEQIFRFRLFFGNNVNAETLEAEALAMQRPPLIGDLTRGMPTEFRSTTRRTM